MKKYNIKDDTKNDPDLQGVYNYEKYPRGSKINSDKSFVLLDIGSQGGTHWICFIVKDNKSYYFGNFGGKLDKFSLNQLPKPILYRNYETQGINSKLCGSY